MEEKETHDVLITMVPPQYSLVPRNGLNLLDDEPHYVVESPFACWKLVRVEVSCLDRSEEEFDWSYIVGVWAAHHKWYTQISKSIQSCITLAVFGTIMEDNG